MPELTAEVPTKKYGEVKVEFKDGKLVKTTPPDARFDPEIKEFLKHWAKASSSLL